MHIYVSYNDKCNGEDMITKYNQIAKWQMSGKERMTYELCVTPPPLPA